MNNKLFSLFSLEAEKIDAIIRADLENINNNLLHKIISYVIFNGGKRIRPILTILVARLCQTNLPLNEQCLYHFAICFEYLHTTSLLHDDVIDNAQQRRGAKSANQLWNNTPVILAGDFLHSRAMFLAGTLGTEKCFRIICKAVESMVHSEFIQLENAEILDTCEQNYYQVLQGKTAALISAACETGGVYAGASLKQCQALATFGQNIGLSFQIVDDVLDYKGNTEKTGKVLGNDFREGKMTLPLIYSLNHANQTDKQTLMNLLQADPKTRMAGFTEAKNIIEETGGFAHACQKKQQLIDEAMNSLTIFPDCAEKDDLLALSIYVSQREH